MELEYTVSELNNSINSYLVSKFTDNIKVKGEATNVKNSNGHLYFTLKDSTSMIQSIMWSSQRQQININIESGNKVTVIGKIKGYTKTGSYNLIVSDVIKEAGVGDIYLEYNKRKEEFKQKGYFDNKKTLPNIINNIGIITAKDGAAIKDILFVLTTNEFKGNVYIKNTSVQGIYCPSSVIENIEYFEKNQETYKLDILLITRGGGSFEDLYGFSDEKMLEKIYACNIFTISAIGHEIDFMLSDFVADLRAPTPSIAGQIISKYWSNINEEITLTETKQHSIKKNILSQTDDYIYELENIYVSVTSNIIYKIQQYKNRLDKCTLQIKMLNVSDILNKGYNLLLDDKQNIINYSDISENQTIYIKTAQGIITVQVINKN